MNLDKLKGKLVEKNKTYKDCAKYLGVSLTTFNKKMNNRSKWYVEEVVKLGRFLNLSKNEMMEFFLNNN